MMITIKCPKCQTDNLYDAEFCRYCGLRLAKDCPSCNAINPHQFTYCTQCGHALATFVIPVLEVEQVAGEEIVEVAAPKEEVKEEEIPVEARAELEEEAKPEEETPKEEAVEARAELEEEAKPEEETPKEEAVEAEEQPQGEPEGIETEIKEEPKEEPKPEATEERRERLIIDIAMPDRVSTGISGLDPLIGGGFLAGKVYLISGESGTGKTVFGMQFLYQGLILGENGIYISGDELPSHLIVDAESLGWNFKNYIQQNKLGLLDISSHFTDIRSGKVKAVDVHAVVADIARSVKELNAKRIVIDTAAPLVFGQESLPCIQEYLRQLLLTIENDLGCTALVTSGIPSGFNVLSHYGVEEFVAEGVIFLDVVGFSSYRFRTLSIRKMRSTLSDLNDHVFEILPQRGIVLKG